MVPISLDPSRFTPYQSSACAPGVPVAFKLKIVAASRVMWRMGVVYTLVSNAVPVARPVDLMRQFSEDMPSMVVFWPPTKRAPSKSTSARKKYVYSSRRVITPDMGSGRSEGLDTNTKPLRRKSASRSRPRLRLAEA